MNNLWHALSLTDFNIAQDQDEWKLYNVHIMKKMLKQVEHESAPGMKISFGWEDFQNTKSFRMGISASYSLK